MKSLLRIQPSWRKRCQDPFIYSLTVCFWNRCPELAPGLPVCGCVNEQVLTLVAGMVELASASQ